MSGSNPREEKKRNNRIHRSFTSSNKIRLETKKQHQRSSTSKLLSPGFLKSPTSLRIFNKDLDTNTALRLCKQKSLAIDTETEGLSIYTSRLCLLQISTADGRVYVIRQPGIYSKHLIKVLENINIAKIFHNAAFDLEFIYAWIRCGVLGKIECTKTLSKIIDPGKKSGLNSLLNRHLDTNIPKVKMDFSKWLIPNLSKEQKTYISDDVIYLHPLLNKMKKKATPQQLILYQRATKLITGMKIINVQGYNDLWSYPEEEYEKAIAKRLWWQREPMKVQGDL